MTGRPSTHIFPHISVSSIDDSFHGSRRNPVPRLTASAFAPSGGLIKEVTRFYLLVQRFDPLLDEQLRAAGNPRGQRRRDVLRLLERLLGAATLEGEVAIAKRLQGLRDLERATY